MNAMQVGMQLFQEIEAKRTSGNWTWEKYLPGPISSEDADIIMRLAGCWCYDPSADQVRFYTNQNHPSHGGKPW